MNEPKYVLRWPVAVTENVDANECRITELDISLNKEQFDELFVELEEFRDILYDAIRTPVLYALIAESEGANDSSEGRRREAEAVARSISGSFLAEGEQ